MALITLARKLAFLLISASIIVSCPQFLCAQERSSKKELQQLAQLANIHCRLWLRHLTKLPPPVYLYEYQHALGNEKLTKEEAELLHGAYHGLPDFGFMLGTRWEFANRSERQKFNYYFLQWLTMQFQDLGHPTGEYSKNYCMFDISLSVNSAKHTMLLPPPTETLAAIVHSLLPGKDSAMSVKYYAEKQPDIWVITEISLNGMKLSQRYAKEFATIVSSQGFAGLNQWFLSQAGTYQSHKAEPHPPR